MAKMEIEEIYQKKTQLEHVLLRPDTYIGSVEYCNKTLMWVYDNNEEKIVQREISFVPGLYKIFDEILVNAADNKQRDPKMNVLKVNIDKEKNEISVFNNGKGIPVVIHSKERMYVPEMIFGTLLTSSNYNDSEKKVTGGRNGYGAKLCNIFSTKFVVETSSKEYHKKFKQVWVDSMQKKGDPIVEKSTGEDFTRVTFRPDLKRFGMSELEDDIIALMSRRAFDVAGSTRGVKVFLNNKLIPVQGFKQYVELYTKNTADESGEPLKMCYEQAGPRWEVALTVSDKGFQQVSFVNSIATTKGGRHVDYVADQIVAKLIEVVKKKIGKNGLQVKPFQVKNHMWVFVNCLVENPTFDSQTKETMTLQAKSFGSKCELSDKFANQAAKCGIVESIMSWVRFKQAEQQDKKCATKKTSKLKGIPKLEDANDAGGKNSRLCTLIVTEGDSAKSLAVAGLGVIGRDRYGVFPLRGKMLNVREASHKQIVENAEITALLKILGLQYRLKYDNDEEFKTLRYGKLMIMADQDQDGSHIKGLMINFIHHNWPHLIKRNFVEEFITPIMKATKSNDEQCFYSIPEYLEWRKVTENWRKYRIKYYKGLGTSDSNEAKKYFSNMARHRIPFKYADAEDDNAIDLAFSKKRVEDRKAWLTNYMEGRKQRRLEGTMEDVLYDKETRSISFADFVNRELVLFSNADNERSIPSLVDGLKPGQRKVLFTCFKRADTKEVKVAQLAGAVGEMSAYHHGEQMLMLTIVNLAQDFVGSNNVNLLLPIGQFGTRLQGGKDSASPRYIFTQLNSIAKALFPSVDDNVLRFLVEEKQRIEPEWYCPIIPMVLVNGAEGIGTGWSTKIPNYNPRDIVDNIRRLIRGEPMKPMLPWYRNFKGTIAQLDAHRFVCSGEIATLSDDTIEITELPVKTWTQNYKESVIEPMMESAGPDKPAQILDYKEYHTDKTVRFIVRMQPDRLRRVELDGLHKFFKLQSCITTTSMVLFDANGCLRRFNTPEEICQEFFETRKRMYVERKRWQEGMLRAQSAKLSEQARFILMKIEGKIVIENKRKVAIIEQLVRNKFPPDPVKRWKDDQRKREAIVDDQEEAEAEADAVQPSISASKDGLPMSPEQQLIDRKVSDFDYLVGMALWRLSAEDKDKLLAESRAKEAELTELERKSWSDLWEADLNELMTLLDARDKKEREEITKSAKKAEKGIGKQYLKAEAIRVVPTLDDMKSKYEVKPKKAKVEKSENSAENVATEDGENGRTISAENSDKLQESGISLKGGAVSASSSSATSASSKSRKPPTAGSSAAKPPKMTKKRKKEWDSDATESGDDNSDQFLFDDEDDELDFVPTTAAASKKPKVETSEDKKVKKTEKKQPLKNGGGKVASSPKKKATPKSEKSTNGKATPKKQEQPKQKPKKANSDGESDFEMGDDSFSQPSPAAPRAATRPARKVATAKKTVIESDSDDVFDSDGQAEDSEFEV